MSGTGKTENAVSIIIEAGDFQFNDVLEASDARTAREAGRSIANFALSQFSTPRRRNRLAREAETPVGAGGQSS